MASTEEPIKNPIPYLRGARCCENAVKVLAGEMSNAEHRKLLELEAAEAGGWLELADALSMFAGLFASAFSESSQSGITPMTPVEVLEHIRGRLNKHGKFQ